MMFIKKIKKSIIIASGICYIAGVNAAYKIPDESVNVYDEKGNYVRTVSCTDGKGIAVLPSPKPNNELFVISMAFSPNGKKLCACYQDGTIKLWNLESNNNSPEIKRRYPSYHVKFEPHGKFIATCTYGDIIELWDPTNLRELKCFSEKYEEYKDWYPKVLEFSANGYSIATGSSHGINGGLFRIWSQKAIDQLVNYEIRSSNETESYDRLVFSPNGKLVALCISTNSEPFRTKIQIYKYSYQKIISECICDMCVHSIHFENDEILTLLGTDSNEIKISHISLKQSGKIKSITKMTTVQIEETNYEGMYDDKLWLKLFFSPDHKFIICQNEYHPEIFTLWNTKTINLRSILKFKTTYCGQAVVCVNKEANLIAFGFKSKIILINPNLWAGMTT